MVGLQQKSGELGAVGDVVAGGDVNCAPRRLGVQCTPLKSFHVSRTGRWNVSSADDNAHPLH